MRKTVRALGALGAATGGMLLMAGPASAHISPTPSEVPADGFTAVSLTVGHGCDDSPTKQLTIEVPSQLNEISPQVQPGWDIEVKTEDLAEPIDDGEGGEITERASQVVYTAQRGNELPPHFRDVFTLGFKAPDAEGEYLFFKTVQTCVEGETPWIEEYTGEGEEPEHPSPAVLIGPAGEDEHGGGAEAEEAEPEAEEVAATAAADGSSDDGDSSTGIAVAGLVAGLLGLGAGGLALVRNRKPASS
jgi:periplasmic copper chaperone A